MNAARKVPITLFGEKSSPSKAFNLVPPRLCAYDTNSPVYGVFISRTTGIVVSLIIMSGQLLTLAAFPPMLVRGGGTFRQCRTAHGNKPPPPLPPFPPPDRPERPPSIHLAHYSVELCYFLAKGWEASSSQFQVFRDTPTLQGSIDK